MNTIGKLRKMCVPSLRRPKAMSAKGVKGIYERVTSDSNVITYRKSADGVGKLKKKSGRRLWVFPFRLLD